MSGEKASADEINHKRFREEFKIFVEREGLTKDKIYNCNKTGRYSQMLLFRTLAFTHEEMVLGFIKRNSYNTCEQ